VALNFDDEFRHVEEPVWNLHPMMRWALAATASNAAGRYEDWPDRTLKQQPILV
jgi:hypothetical protein